MMRAIKGLVFALALSVGCAGALGVASAQVPVIDAATLTQATTTAGNTAQIMQSNQQILAATNATLAAVTGAPVLVASALLDRPTDPRVMRS